MRVFRMARFIAGLAVCLSMVGCAHQYGHILANNDKDLVGSHAAGAATWNPLVDEAVAKLLGRCPPAVQPVAFEGIEYATEGAAPIGSALAVRARQCLLRGDREQECRGARGLQGPVVRADRHEAQFGGNIPMHQPAHGRCRVVGVSASSRLALLA